MITEDLYFDMAGRWHEALDIHLAIAKSRVRFRLAAVIRLLDVVDTANNAHPAAAASCHSFNDDRGVHVSGLQKGLDLSEACRPCGTGQDGHSALAGQLTRAHLIAKQFEQFGARSDEDKSCFGASSGEPGILAEESVSGMNRITASLLSDRHDLLPVEVHSGASATQLAGLV